MEQKIYKHQRKLNRLKDYDYSSEGAYFITICIKGRVKFLSEIKWDREENVGDDVLGVPLDTHAYVLLTDWGEIVEKHIKEMDMFYENINVDNYVIMPNHIHMILTIKDTAHKSGETEGTPRTVENLKKGTPRTSSPTHSLIPQFVSTLKRFCNKEFGMNIFQRSYHDHIIRDQEDYNRKYEYIERNPLEWKLDDYYFERGIVI